MTLFSIFGISIIGLLTSFFSPHLLHAQTLSHSNQRKTSLTTKVSTTQPQTFPSMQTMQKVNTSIAPTSSTTLNNNLQKISPSPIDTQLATFLSEINQYRASNNLTQVAENDVVCNFAKIRAKEISTNFSHDGFNSRVQGRSLPYSTYSLVTENIAETPNYKDVITLWKNSPVHAQNMRADTPYVCVESYGNYYAYEGLKP